MGAIDCRSGTDKSVPPSAFSGKSVTCMLQVHRLPIDAKPQALKKKSRKRSRFDTGLALRGTLEVSMRQTMGVVTSHIARGFWRLLDCFYLR